MSVVTSLVFLVSVLRIGVPYVLAALGGTASERGGVVNIALEGMLLTGAFGYVLAAHLTGSPWLGLLGGLLGGELVALLLIVAVVRLRADAIVTGVALNLLAAAGTRFCLKLIWDSSSNSGRVEGFPTAPGALGGLLLQPVFLLTLALVGLAPLLLFRTRFGLRLRACGEHPEAAASQGVSVARTRSAGVLLSGLLAGLGGVWLAAEQHQFSDGMSAGRGYIALAAMITGKWHPLGAAAACLLFAGAEAAQIALQGQGTGIPSQLLQMLPHVLTLVTLVGFIGRSRAPAALGQVDRG